MPARRIRGRRPRRAALLAGSASGLLLIAPAGGQEIASAGPGEAPYRVVRIEEPIQLDGRAEEAAWRAIAPVPVFTHYPTFGVPPTERTEFRIAYDDEYLYFACLAFDSDPAGIRMYSLERDETGFRSDWCSIYLDTLNDEENSLQFKTGPGGNRSDSQRTNDGESSDNSWNAFWDVEVSRDEGGWYAEIRIPFSSVLLQSVDGRVVMGVSMVRNIARKNERHTHPAIRPELGNAAHAKPSRMRKIVLEGVRPQGTPAYLTPYVLAGGGYTHDTSGAGARRTNGRVREAGSDLRLGVTQNLTLDLTVNTDFAQVEADDQQVNLTRFSLFFPEKRRFFQERASNFEFALGGEDRLFHSRTVGLASGEPVPILGGGRLVGRIGESDIGILNLQTEASALLPSENLGAVRLRRRVWNANSYVGGMLTSRVGAGGDRNVAYGTDGIFRVADNDYLVLTWAQSFDSGDGALPSTAGAVGALDRGVARLFWERRGLDRLTYRLDLVRVGGGFRPGMGFLQRTGFARAEGGLAYGWRFEPGSPLYTLRLQLDGGVLRRTRDGAVETVEVEPNVALMTWRQHRIQLSAPLRYENLEAPFDLPEGTSVTAGVHRFGGVRLRYQAPQADAFRADGTVEAGRFFDGWQASLTAGPVWGPSAHLNLAAHYRLDRVEFPERAAGFTSHLLRFRARVALSTRSSAIAFVQYSKTDDSIVANLRFRYNPTEGTDLYIVWNEGLVTDRGSLGPVRPLSDERTILIKYAHTLQFGL